MKDSHDIIAALKEARKLSSSITQTLNHSVFPYSPPYIYYEQYLTIDADMVLGIGVSSGE